MEWLLDISVQKIISYIFAHKQDRILRKHFNKNFDIEYYINKLFRNKLKEFNNFNYNQNKIIMINYNQKNQNQKLSSV